MKSREWWITCKEWPWPGVKTATAEIRSVSFECGQINAPLQICYNISSSSLWYTGWTLFRNLMENTIWQIFTLLCTEGKEKQRQLFCSTCRISNLHKLVICGVIWVQKRKPFKLIYSRFVPSEFAVLGFLKPYLLMGWRHDFSGVDLVSCWQKSKGSLKKLR